MRILAVLVLVAALLLATGTVRLGFETMADGEASAAASADSGLGGAEASEEAEQDPTGDSAASRAEPDEASASTYYQWVDERGSVHFARSLAEVPADWRDRAGRIELESAPSEPAAPPARPAAAKRAKAARVAQKPAPDRAHDVTVYTAPWCSWCRKTVAFLDQRGIEYVNKDVDSNPEYAQELHEKSGSGAIPFVEIDGTQIRGFSPQQMTALLR